MVANLNPLTWICSPVVIFSIIFSSAYDFTRDLTPPSLEPKNSNTYDTSNTIEYGNTGSYSETLTSHEWDSNDSHSMAAPYNAYSSNPQVRHKREDPSFLIPSMICLICIALFLKWCIRSKGFSSDLKDPPIGLISDEDIGTNWKGDSDSNAQKKYPNAGEGNINAAIDVPTVPKDETLEQSMEELLRLSFEISRSQGPLPKSLDSLKKDYLKRVESWASNIQAQANALVKGSRRRQAFVNRKITPNIGRANPVLARFASEQIKAIVNISFGNNSIMKDFRENLVFDISFFDGSEQCEFDYSSYSEFLDGYRQTPQDSLSYTGRTVLTLFDNMIPRLVRVNNYAASYLEPIHAALDALNLPELPHEEGLYDYM